MSTELNSTNAAVRVGLVDTGLGAGPDRGVNSALIAARGFAWDDPTRAVSEIAARPDQLGHGSALSATLVAAAPGVQLLMAQVFFQRWRTRPAQVAAAIDWLCASGAQVINLSLGLREDRPVLQRACDSALAAGVILVASAPARGDRVFPAAYDGVIRATGDARCARADFSWLDSAQADVGACVVTGCGSVAGASAGAVYISAHIARFLQMNSQAGREQVLDYLRQHASYTGPERRSTPPA